MKNKSIKIFISVLALFAVSCEENFTELDRGFIIVEETVENLDDVDRLLSGAYDSMTYTGIVSRNSIASDEVRIGLGNRGQGLQEHSHTISSGDGGPAGLWNGLYNTIDNANIVISFLDRLTIDPSEQDRADSFRGQALAIRALSHFDLLRAYAPDFNPSSPGVIVASEALVFGVSDLAQPRASVGDVLALINSDLDAAENLIPATLNGDYERFNQDVLNAIRARLALYTGAYTDAITYSTAVLNNIPIITGDDYFDMFRSNTSPDDNVVTETIFQIERDITNGNLGSVWTAGNFDVFFSMGDDLFNEMSLAGEDRFNTNIDLEVVITEDAATADEFLVGKFLGADAATAFNVHHRVFRSSEMVLIRAEANAMLGNLPAAQMEIETFRGQRESTVITPMYTDENTAILDILRERRVELAFEGHRFFDLNRLNMPLTRVVEDCNNPNRTAPTSCGLTANNDLFTYPIPQAELFANPAIGDAEQNPGY